MAAFMDQDFLLPTSVAQRLYHEVAAHLPIIDYHSHLIPGEIAGRRKFRNLSDLWLGGDHYKWRLMRSSGVSEDLITGQCTDKEKFDAFCAILPLAIGNPIHHWSHLELRRLFGIDLLINAANADAIWNAANSRLATMDAWDFLERDKVEIACTTDDPADDLAAHAQIAASALQTRVLPAYRPDSAMAINDPGFTAYLERLAAVVGSKLDRFETLIEALIASIDYFHHAGARIADHSVEFPLPDHAPEPAEIESFYQQGRRGERLTPAEVGRYVIGNPMAFLSSIRVCAKASGADCRRNVASRDAA